MAVATPRGWTAAELAVARFAPVRWVVPGLLRPGLVLLGGTPKTGKSLLCEDLALAVASVDPRRPALGGLDVATGDVLYLALEESPDLVQERQTMLLAGAGEPERLVWWFECPPLADGGGRAIQGWLEATPGARLVVVDLLARVGARGPGGLYAAEYAELARVKKLADRHRVCVLVVTHTRKRSAEDFAEEISGTQGRAGAADTVMVLRRPRGGSRGILHATGRGIPESRRLLVFDAGRWSLLEYDGGPAVEPADGLGATRGAILAALLAGPGQGPKALAAVTGLPADTVSQTVRRMVADGQLRRVGRGAYEACQDCQDVSLPGQDPSRSVSSEPAEPDTVRTATDPLAGVPADETGPCAAGCGTRVRRYGPEATGPLCPTCRAHAGGRPAIVLGAEGAAE